VEGAALQIAMSCDCKHCYKKRIAGKRLGVITLRQRVIAIKNSTELTNRRGGLFTFQKA
jgi:hypothetical protein